MKKNLLMIFTISLCCIVKSTNGQDVHFSQFFNAPLLRNPSLAGIFDGDVRIQGVYRSQWGSVTTPYQTGSFDVEVKKPIGQGNDFITLGMQILYDRAGDINFTTTNFLPAVNYNKSLNGDKRKFLSFGFMGGLVQRKIDRSKMTTNNQYDGHGYNPSLADGETFNQANYRYWDGSFGVSYNSSIGQSDVSNYFFGLAYHHFNRPVNSFYRNPPIELNPKWVASGGLKLAINDYSYVSFQADYSMQGSAKEIIAGGMYSRKIGDDMDNPLYTLHLGAYMRWQDAIIPVIKLDYNPFSLSFSYDVNTSPLKTASQLRGGFELSIAFIGFNSGYSTKDAVLCPKF